MNASDRISPAAVPVRGVLFDIDDTLVDSRSAAIQGFSSLSAPAPALAHLNPEQVTEIAADFADDGAQAYDRFMAGELTFLGQREVRLQRAYRLAGASAASGEAYARWAHEYEMKVRESWKPFGDVPAFLGQLKSLGSRMARLATMSSHTNVTNCRPQGSPDSNASLVPIPLGHRNHTRPRSLPGALH